MKRSDFIKEVAERTELSQKKVKDFLDVVGDVIVDRMADEDGVKPFIGITFSTRYREERKGHNPQTGEEIMIASKNIPICKFGKAVKEAVA